MVKYYSKSMSTAFSISRVDKRKNPNKNDNNLNYFIDIFGDKVVDISKRKSELKSDLKNSGKSKKARRQDIYKEFVELLHEIDIAIDKEYNRALTNVDRALNATEKAKAEAVERIEKFKGNLISYKEDIQNIFGKERELGFTSVEYEDYIIKNKKVEKII